MDHEEAATRHRLPLPASPRRHFREDLYGLAHVTGWKPYDLHNLATPAFCTLYADPVQHLTTSDTGSTAGCLGRGLFEVWNDWRHRPKVCVTPHLTVIM